MLLSDKLKESRGFYLQVLYGNCQNQSPNAQIHDVAQMRSDYKIW